MDEAEWLTGTDLSAKIDFLGDRLTSRKARLIAVACGRSVPPFTGNQVVGTVLDALERIADEPEAVGREEMAEAFRQLADVLPTGLFDREILATAATQWAFSSPPQRIVSVAATLCAEAESRLVTLTGWTGPGAQLPDRETVSLGAAQRFDHFLQEIVGNPFRPVGWDPAWRTADVRGVAAAIDEDRAMERLPLLADALMDAGCTDEQLLGHLRSIGPHVRGCWVVDLALDKR